MSYVTITGGKWKKHKVYFKPNKDLRPTTGRMRQRIFSWLMYEVNDGILIDLFAGSGILGIEAMSRFSSNVIFVDKSYTNGYNISNCLKKIQGKNKVVLKNNLLFNDKFNNDFNAIVNVSKVNKFLNDNLKILENQVQGIFVDPPYNSTQDDFMFLQMLPVLLKKNGWIIIESVKNNDDEIANKFINNNKNISLIKNVDEGQSNCKLLLKLYEV